MAKFRMIISRIFSRGNYVEVPTILQAEIMESGAAALAMVLAFYGCWVPLEKLRQECGISRDGSKIENILKAAQKYKCSAEIHEGNVENLKGQNFPLIAAFKNSRFVVVEDFSENEVRINNPERGQEFISLEKFKDSYDEKFIALKPSADFQKMGQPYDVGSAVVAKLIEDKNAMIFIFLLGLCMILPGLALPVFQQIFLDEILTLKHVDWAGNLFVAMLIAFALTAIMNWVRAAILTNWQKKLTLADSNKFFWHVLKLPLAFFQQRYSADIAARIQFNEINARVLSGFAAPASLDVFIAIFYLLLLLQYSISMTIIGLLASFVNIGLIMYLRQRLTDFEMRIQKDKGRSFGVIMNGLSTIESVKANGTEMDLFAQWAGYHASITSASQEKQFFTAKVKFLPQLLTSITGALIMTVGGFSIMEGVMTAGIYVAFTNLLAKCQEPLQKLLLFNSTLRYTEMRMRNLDDVLRYPVDDLNYPEKQDIKFSGFRLSGEVTLKNISFGYNPLDPPLIENFNMHLEPGHCVAIIGVSGSGKSTLAKIIVGLYEEWSGEILFDGVKRREISRAVIVNSLSSVDQDIFQITGTVRENISLFDNSISKEDVIRAAKDACIHDDIIKLSGNYEAEVAEGGVNFSGGQRQRLEIARALANNPSILILDEATSALDPLTEQKCLENIRRRGCTCIIIAHRLSTIRDADEIIVLNRGKVVERGTHRDMIKNDGAYRRLIEDAERESANVVD